jgi:hypothetical protein
MRLRLRIAAAIFLLAGTCSAAKLTAPARQAFENYAAALEKRLALQHASPDTYLAVFNLELPQRAHVLRQLKSGAMRIEPVNGGTRDVGGALLHHWRGTAFVPGGHAQDMLALLRDFNHLASYYAPEVESSHFLSERPGSATVAMRMRKQKVVTVVLDTEYDVRTGLIGNAGYGFSRSTHIWQVANPGAAAERRLPEGNDDGFLWRLNSYWSFVQLPDGLLIECEAISLTRDVPTGLAWLMAPIIESMPRESMTSTLGATSKALSSMLLERANHERRMQDASEGINARR